MNSNQISNIYFYNILRSLNVLIISRVLAVFGMLTQTQANERKMCLTRGIKEPENAHLRRSGDSKFSKFGSGAPIPIVITNSYARK